MREIAMRIVQGGDTSQSSHQLQNSVQQILQVIQGHAMLYYIFILGWIRLTRVIRDLSCDTNVFRLLLDDTVDVDISNLWNKRPIQITKNTSVQQIMTNFSKEYSSSDEKESVCLSKVDWTADNLFIQYLSQVKSAPYSPEKIMDAEPLYPIDPPTDDEECLPEEKN
ncbi:unnamed protein product [Rhizopus stolonifer]